MKKLKSIIIYIYIIAIITAFAYSDFYERNIASAIFFVILSMPLIFLIMYIVMFFCEKNNKNPFI